MTYRHKLIILLAATIGSLLLYLFWNLDIDTWQYALSKRWPKSIALIMVGTIIAISTLLFQTIVNNRILTPSILGVDSLYVMIQTMLVYFFAQFNIDMINSTFNFFLSLVLMVLFAFVLYNLLFKSKKNIYILLLIGTVFGTLFRSITSFFQMVLDPNQFLILQGRLFASFNNIQLHLLVVTFVLVVALIPYIYDYVINLDVLLLGKDTAINLGIDYDKTTKKMFVVVVILTSLATALVGPITFLGILVVNLSYEFARTYQHTKLLLFAVLMGITALVGGQLLIERVFNFAIPLSVVINFIGGSYFVYLLLKERNT